MTVTSNGRPSAALEPGKKDNTFHLFEAGGHEWIVLALE